MKIKGFMDTKSMVASAKTQQELDLITIITFKEADLSELQEKYNKLEEEYNRILTFLSQQISVTQSDKDYIISTSRFLAGLKED